MMRTMLKWVVTGLCSMLAACAIITVNVYFPEKAVKDAYKSLDEMLLKPGDEQSSSPTAKPPAEQPAEPGTSTPQSRLFDRLPSISFVSQAWAADNYADELAIELSSMPDVLRAYDEMRARLPQLDALRTSGVVGETNQGLVTVRDKGRSSAQTEALVKAENDNRKTVITGMARAIIKLNKQKESKAAINQVLGKAAATYADTRREEARPGWWVQLANGRWVQK
ncbi:lipoprotein [Geotalea uraniireducens]|uniref:Lipoprotein n=1 Tax=Geotalea uraniireducens TaxID=351604 RepID=A0ABM8EPX1_9BACT|nr:YdbL family protein [Geotalea uraniireducens]BDV44528.1 lipoprotein [Geotalea uraniireducens]